MTGTHFRLSDRRRTQLLVAALLVLCVEGRLGALTLEELDPHRDWHVGSIEISGNDHFSDRELLGVIATPTRAWFAFWRPRPLFDPVTFETDLQRLHRFHEARGYYHVQIGYDLVPRPDSDIVDIDLTVEEDAPVIIAAVTVTAPGHESGPDEPSLEDLLPLKTGEQFSESAYQQGEGTLLAHFLDHGFAWATVTRRAEVNVQDNTAAIEYTVTRGPACLFGTTFIEGTEKVDPDLIRREILYSAGEPFSPQPVTETRTRILALGLFRSVQIGADTAAKGEPVVPMAIRVSEGPQRSIKLGVTYNTQDEIGGQAEWRHLDWLGGGRQLSFSLKGTQFNSFLAAKLVQPHFLDSRNTGILEFRQDIDDESTYLLTASQLRPRIERRIVSNLSGFLGYRAEHDALSSVDTSVIDALGAIKRDGVLSGPRLGLVWNSTEKSLNPQQGEILTLTAEQPGGIWGGAFNFWKVVVEGRKYFGIGWDTVLAMRLELGFSDALGAEDNLPLFDRFYAGGENSVRGYARRQLGPLSSTGKPLGGLTLIEGSVELRRPIYRMLGGAVFLDFGQVSLDPYDVPIGSLKLSTGPGISVDTPVGPLLLFVGFPIDPPPGERSWQVTFSVGQFF